jgi:hypothetical protein
VAYVRSISRLIYWPVARSALRWSTEHTVAESLRFCSRDFVRLKYERFARDPAPVLGALCGRLRIPAPRIGADRNAELVTNHTAGGNRIRFDVGPVTIHKDDVWKQEMPAPHVRTATLISAPMLLRHGYSLAVAKQPEAARAGPVV